MRHGDGQLNMFSIIINNQLSEAHKQQKHPHMIF